MRAARKALLIAFTSAFSLGAEPAAASFPPTGLAVTTAPNDQDDPQVCTDGAGGAIVIWQDSGLQVGDIFAGHVLDSGALDPAWPVNGRLLIGDPGSLGGTPPSQAFPLVVSDGAGGAIVAWQDGRGSPSGSDVYAQHVLASGILDARWPANGTALCTAPGVQNNLAIVSDGEGGAIVTWMDGRNSANGVDIFAQHVLATGAVDPAWPADGVGLCNARDRQAFPRIASDGSGGAIVTWYDFRDKATTSFDIYAQHVLRAGATDPGWPVNGKPICIHPAAQIDPAIVTDGAHGAIIAWNDGRDPVGDVYSQHVLASGALDPAWPADGLPVCTDPNLQERPIVATDGAGGAIVSWADQRSGTFDMFAHHVLVTGAVDVAWPLSGRALSTTPLDQSGAVMIEDGAGGAIVAWQDGFDVVAQHVGASGALDSTFPSDGKPVISLAGVQSGPSMVADAVGGAIVAWTDRRSGTASDIFAGQLQVSGTTGVGGGPGPHALSFERPSPNPAGATVTLRFALPSVQPFALDIYDATGRRVRRLSPGTRGAGEQSIPWDLRDEAGRTLGAGIYFARLEAGAEVLTQRIAKVH